MASLVVPHLCEARLVSPTMQNEEEEKKETKKKKNAKKNLKYY